MKRYPLLYQVNTRVLLEERSHVLQRPATLDDLPSPLLDSIGSMPFDWLWLLGVWRTGAAGWSVSRSDPRIRRELVAELPDVSDEDITGSPFAIQAYEPREQWGGRGALGRVRARLRSRGLRLLLDFVPNHVALDHPWVDEHPEYLIQGTEDDLAREPHNYVKLRSRERELVFAYGRDPYFPGWPDTLQLNYFHVGLRRAMIEQLCRVARHCDGVRCDMAMLVMRDVFERTWGERCQPSDGSKPAQASFWPTAIEAVRAEHPDFVFIAEAYWDLEWKLQQEGFDYTYDKRLYDRLRAGSGRAVRGHLQADLEYQRRSARFLENHDEPRAAASFPPEVHRAAALITYLVPGLRFFHEGQLDGRRVHVSMHVKRRPDEPVDSALRRFYAQLLDSLRRPELHEGEFYLHECHPAWPGNDSFEDLIVLSWALQSRRLLVVVNFAAHQTQGYVTLSWPDLADQTVILSDVFSSTRYEREGNELAQRGLYLDLRPWAYHVFDCHPASAAPAD